MERDRIRFAWLPVPTTTGWLWLRHYVVRERRAPDYGGWTAGVWELVERRAVPELD